MLNKENAKMRIKYFGKSFVSFFWGGSGRRQPGKSNMCYKN